jgi:N-glycosylase/DNA lyase
VSRRGARGPRGPQLRGSHGDGTQELHVDTALVLTTQVGPTTQVGWEVLWSKHRAHYCRVVDEMRTADERALHAELLFCLLSGHGVPFELALSAARHLGAFSIFSRRRSADELRELLVHELSRSQFEPRRRDGELRRYRYPRRKADVLTGARQWLLARLPLYDQLASIGDERRRRRFLCECPGMGYKTASWLLRNVGLAENLAVVDVHVLRALAQSDRLGRMRLPRDYEKIEAAFLDWCRELSAPPAAFDLFVWEVQRGDRRAVGCDEDLAA